MHHDWVLAGLNLSVAAICGLIGGAATLAATPFLIRHLTAHGILDVPGPRSNHVAPVPRGGGLAIVGPLALVWLGLNVHLPVPAFMWIVLSGVVMLTAISWLDDRHPQPVVLRLLAQALAVALPLLLLPSSMRLAPDLFPMTLERLLLALAWVWFINVVNFMDGLDGLATGQVATASVAVAAIAIAFPALAYPGYATAIAVALAASALAFLPFNWPPARVFLGDSGSVPLGYVTGFLLLMLALAGAPLAALILPTYFIADATGTLVHRLLKGERITEAHSTHLYQRARRAGKSHTWVATRVLVANILLAVSAFFAVTSPLTATVCALFVLGTIGLSLAAAARRNRPTEA
ncbi:glycosyl transferase [Tepidamorphus sp. 3E244]|uniref:glycosyl transferase n=1 Tax=Tepidamorphus sp. 3E244 TaxID=3385498 RepID=UPI0038FC53EB